MRKGNLRSTLSAGTFVKGSVKAMICCTGMLFLSKPLSAQTTTFNYTGSVQSYTVPAGVTTATITCNGAQGGNSTSPAQSGGHGASMSGVFTVTPGHVLNILVGQQPASCQYNAGGGGGSFVWDVTAGNTLLIAAGGGGGANGNVGSGVNGIDASAGTSGVLGGGATGGAGTGGNGASSPTGSSFWGGGGAGWNSNGANGTNGGCTLNSTGGTKPLSGGAGGAQGGTSISPPNGNGGFGGGGGGQGLCGNTGGAGGGGGYSGGTAGTVPGAVAAQPGGGGGSFNSGSSQSNSVGHTGNGSVVISTPLTILSISSVSPNIANTGSSVTISGANFSSTSANDLVTFGGSLATVTSASTSSLTVTVPTGALYGPVSVTNTALGQTAYQTNAQFLPTWSGPASTTSFNTHVDFTNSGLAGIAIGDLDGDGKLDMVVSKQGSNIVQVYFNTSTSGSITTGSFAAPVSFGAGSGPAYVAIADIDGDGKPEIIASDFGSNTVAILRNTATAGVINSGSFASAVTFGVGSSPEGIAVGDLNGDGKPDLAVLNQTLGTMSLLQNTSTPGTISFNSQVVFSTGSVPFFISIADVDGDGWPDIVETNFNSNNFKVFLNTGAGGTISAGTLASASTFGGNSETIGLAVVDIDGDGKQDVVVSNFGSANLSVFLNTSTSGSVSFAPKVDISALTAPIQLSVADINGDGKPDIISGQGSGGSHVSYFPNNSTSGSVSFGSRMDMAAGLNPEWMSTGDLDGDGKADIAVVNVSGTAGTSVIRNGAVTNNPPTFTGGSPQSLNVCQNSVANSINSLLTISDLDLGQTETWTVISGPSHGSVATGPTQTSTGGSITPTGFSYTPNTSYSGPDAFAVQVSDGNGGTSTTTINVTVNPLPAAITGPTVVCVGSTITLSNTSGGGTWTSSDATIASIGSVSGVVTGVANGNATITYTLAGNCYSTYSIAVGALPTVTSISSNSGIPGNSVTITGTNFNTTTANDIVYFGSVQASVTSATNTSLTVTIPNSAAYYPVISVENNVCALAGWAPYPFLPTFNNAAFVANTTNFDAAVTYATGSFPNQMTYGDIDGDGKTDIVVGNYNSGTILVYRNTSASGTISFAAPVTAVTVSSSVLGRPSVGDIDGDGKLDIVYMTATGPAVMGVLRNTSTVGSISFAAPFTVGYFTNADCSALADIDGDGRLDVIGNFLGHMSVFRNTSSVGSISFAGRVDFTAAGIITGIVAGNIDGDTYPDIALALNNGTTSLSIFRNTSTPGTISFAARQDFTTISGAAGGSTSIRLADLDGDGAQDVVLSANGNLSVFPNSSSVGSISLGARVDFATAGNTGSLSIGDLNGDGKPDVVASSANPVFTFLNNSSGPGNFAFLSPVRFSSGIQSSGVVITDLDGDGKADIAITEQNLNRMSLLRNDPLHPITGTLTACPLSTTTLSDATPGGTWVSGNPAVATVNPATGVVTGVSTGTALISYVGTASTTSINNITTVTVTINANPAGITGVTNVCTGATTSLSDVTPGGTWSSSNGALATVGTSGVVSGINAGNVTISYTLPSTGCYATAPVTVNQSPTPISGSFAICVGGSTTLTDGYSGGAWTSGTTAVATIGSSTGLLSGVTTGTSNIVYTMPGNCTTSQQITVNPNPAAITGVSGICVGTSTTLSDATAGGLWSSSAPSIAAITPGSGLVIGAAAGTVTMTYTLSSTSCYATFPMTINPNPAAITGTASVCVGLTTVLSDATAGGTWSSTAGTTVVNGTVTGVSAGNSTISYTIPSTGCYATRVVTVNANPVAITGTGTVCVGNTTVLSDATGTGSWSSSNIAQATVGSGTGVVTGVAGPSNPIITYTLPTGCINTTTLTVNPLPAAITGTFTACPGTSANLSSTSGGGTWTSNNTAVATIGSSSGTFTGVASGVTTITYTLSTGCFTTASITINPNPAAIVGATSGCLGTSFTLSDGTGGGTWSSANTAIATVGSSSGIVTPVLAACTNISYTLGTGCFAVYNICGNPSPAAIGGPNNVCVGSTVTATDASGTSTWSSSNTALATVGSGTGVVSGIAAGTLTLTFTNGFGCTATEAFTVNTTPAAISGSNNVCVGSTTTLADGTTGGTWSSSNPAFGSISPTGVVTGIAAGTLNISYTLPTGSCSAVMPFTVNTTPAALSGTFSVCTGLTTTLTDATAGGTWSTSNAGIATVVGGTVTGVSSGTANISYTLSAGSCYATQVVTVSSTPPANTGTAKVCVGASTTLANSMGGGTWSSSAPLIATVGSATGVVIGQSAGNANIVYSLGTGCSATTQVTVNPQPAAVTGTFTVCTGQTTVLSDVTAGGTWSSSNGGIATVVGGTVTGVAAGTATISYTLAAGCSSTVTVTVNQTPPAIVGSNTLCIGVPTTMTDGIGGGTWTSQNTALATIGSSSGIALGISTGTLNLSYTLPAGCFAILPVTVNTQPAAVSGASTVCVGQTTTLTDASSPGTWSSSNTSVATVVSGSGAVTGVSAGTVTITFTLTAGGCTSVWPMTVNPSPAAIGGTAVVCVNATTTLTDATPGGTWSSANSAIGSIGSTGIATGVSAGTVAINYTLPAGCASSVTLTVNAIPNLFSVTGGGSYCAGGAGMHIGLSGSNSGINYQLWRGTTPVGSALAGTGVALDFGAITTAGTYTVIATNTITGCSVTMTGSATITVNPLPSAFTVTGGGSYCTGGAGLHVFLSSSVPGVTYQLFNGVTAVSGSVPGTGVLIDFGLQTAAGTYTVQATNVSTGCTNTMTGSVVITINPLPNAYAVTGGGGYCAGGVGMHVGLATSDVGVAYQLYVGGVAVGSPLPGTGAALDFGLQTTAGIYTVVATNVITTCVNNMSGSVTITINPLPTVFAVTGGGGYCIGGTGVIIGVSGSQAGTSYQLYLGGVAVGAAVPGTGGAISFPLQTAAGTYTVVATSGAGCTSTMSGSAVVTINPLPTVFNVTGGGAYCSGGSGVHVGLNGSNIGVSYQLFSGGSPVGGAVAGTGSSIDFGLIAPAGTYTVVATNPTTTCVNNMSGSAVVTINPLPNNTYSVTGGGGYCSGSTGVAVGLSASDAGINYQLYNGISPVGSPLSGGGILNFGLQTTPGTYTVIGTNPITLCSAVMTGSVVVSINPLPTAYALTGGGTYCSGGTGVLVGLANSTIGVNYQLQLGGVNVGSAVAGSGSAISFGLQTGAGTYTVVATNGTTGCVNNMTGSVTISINPLPVVYSVTGGGSYCVSGTGVHVGLGNSNIGINYQLYLGSSPVGGVMAGTNAPLDFGLETAVGTYTVSATSATTGCTSNMSGSATVSTTALPTVVPVLGGGTLCAGGAGVSVNVGPTTVGVNYQLYNGTVAVGAALPGNGGTVIFPPQTTPGTYTVVATDGSGCTSTMSGSATITVNPLPNMYIVTGGGNYCTGGTGVAIGLSGSDAGVTYQLFNPGPVLPTVAGTGSAISFGLKTTIGSYTVVATNTVTGCTRTMTGSALIGTNPLPTAFPISGGGSYCAGGTGVSVSVLASNLGVNYQLYNGAAPIGSPQPGTTGAINFGLQTSPGTYTVTATNASTGCTNSMTGSVTVSVNPLPAVYAVTGGGSYCPGGAGVVVGLNNSAIGTNYQLYVGGTPTGSSVAGTGSALNFGLQAALGNYTVVATSGASCTANMSGSATVANYPLPNIQMVTGGGNYCSGGTGVTVGLNGSDAGIHYQLINAGTDVGIPIPGSGGAITFGLQTTSGTYIVSATNAITGCTDTMADSAVVNIIPLPIVQTLTGGGTYCVGGTGVDIALGGSELGVSYQLYKNGISTGAPIPGTGLSLDFGTYTAAGVYTIIATNTSTLCTVAMAGSDTISLNPPPTAYTITGGGHYCAGGTGVNVSLSNSQLGINYQLYNGTSPVSSPVAGTGSGITFGLETAAGIYTVKATNPVTGCNSNMLGSATVAINPLPTSYNVTGGGGYCVGAPGVHVGLSGSNTGIMYQLYNGVGTVGAPVAGTGAAISFGVYTVTGTYTVRATNSSTTCVSTMGDSAIVALNPLPTAYTVSGSGTSYCAGGSGINVYLSNSQVGVSYQLYRGTTPVGAAMAGTTTALDFGPQTIAGTYTIAASNTTTSCANNMTGSATISINPLPATYAVVGGGSYCPGGSGAHIGLSGSSVGVRYQLYLTGAPVGTPVNGTGSAIDFGARTGVGSYTVVATNAVTGCSNNMTGSASIALNSLPVTYAVTGGGSYCVGGTGVNVGLSGSVSGTNYQLYYGSTPVGGPFAGTGLALNFGTQTFAGTYSVVATDATTGCTSRMADSVAVSVNAIPSVYLVAGGGNYCPGDLGVHVRLMGSATGINYQLYHSGTAVGAAVAGTDSALDFGRFTSTGTYTVVAKNATTGCTANMSGSAVVGLYSLPNVYNVVGGGSYCAGTTGVHVGLSGSTSGISYQLYNNIYGMVGSAVIGMGTPVDFGAQTDTGVYTVVATNSTTTCTSNMTGAATITMNPVVVPTLAISTGGSDTVCAGNLTTFTAIATGAGTSPIYQWSVNGVIATSGNTYTYSAANNDVVSLMMVSNAVCATPSTVNSSVTMTVLPKLMPTVAVTALPGVIVCQGTSVTFTAATTIAGTAPGYLWLKNGLHVGTSSTLTDVPANGDQYYVQLTSSYACPMMATVSSDKIVMEVDTPVTPVVALTADPGANISLGENETITAHLMDAVPYPSYTWFVNGIPVSGYTTPIFTSSTLSDLDVVTCQVTSGGGCPSQTGTASMSIHVTNVGVKQVTANGADFTLVPNPNKGIFVVKGTTGSAVDEEVSIEITDMLGQVIYKDKLLARNGELNSRIQLSNTIANGMYLLNLQTANEHKVFHLVVEQ